MITFAIMLQATMHDVTDWNIVMKLFSMQIMCRMCDVMIRETAFIPETSLSFLGEMSAYPTERRE